MFGVVPKPLWQKVYPADRKNRIAQACNCVLVESDSRKVLIDNGYGPKLTAKERRIYRSELGEPLTQALLRVDVSVDEIDVVVLSHLHFDHAGGATKLRENGKAVPVFPNAQYVVQEQEWQVATADLPELRGAYPQENFLPLQATGQLRLVHGDIEVAPGIRTIKTGGHTAGHQVVVIEDSGEVAVYLGELCPTTRHLPTRWCMAYDLDVLQVRRSKKQLLAQIADNNWLALFDHDPDCAAARLERSPKGDIVLGERWLAPDD